jgi:glycosyltransferase involved in cell wall biosynthesis
MNIFYVTQFFYPERTAAAFRAYDNARIWTQMGHAVTVFTGYPNFPTGKLFKGYTIEILQKEKIEDIDVIRSKIVIKPNTNKIVRAISYLSFTFFSLYNMIFNKKQIEKKYDLVLATSGTVFAPIAGYYYAKKHKIPFVLEIRDITHKQMLATGSSENSIGYKFIRWLELHLSIKADKIIVVTNGFKHELIKAGINKDKIEVIPNGVVVKDTPLTQFNKNDNEIIFSYFGTFGISQDLTRVLHIFSKLKVKNKIIKLILIGDGAEKDKLLQYKQEHQLENILILENKPQAELEKYYQISDFCLVVLKNNNFFKTTIPSKMFQIMGKKRPVIFFGPKGEAASIIEKAKAGLILTEEDINTNIYFLSQYLNELIENNELQKKITEFSLNGFEFVSNNYNREKLAGKYLDILATVIA